MIQRARSIRRRLPLFICALVAAVLFAFTAASYRHARLAQLSLVNARLGSAAQQLAGILATQASQIRSQTTEFALDKAVDAYMVQPNAAAKARAVARLQTIAKPTVSAAGIELRNVDATPLLAVPSQLTPIPVAAVRMLAARLPSGAGTIVGRLTGTSAGLSFPALTRVVDRGKLIGYLVQHRRVSFTSQTSEQIRGLSGLDTRLMLGNAGENVWADFGAPPVADWHFQRGEDGALQWMGDGRRFAAFALIAETPWVIGVDVPTASAITASRNFLRDLLILDVLIFLAAAAGALWLSARLTKPLVELAAAVEGISRGDYARRVAADRDDEFGALARAFNEMSGNLGTAFRELETTSEHLSASTDRYEMLFNASPTPKWVYDVETLRFLAVNQAAIDHYGYSRAEFLSMTIEKIRPPEQVPALLESVAGLRGPERVDGQVWSHRRKDGSTINVEVHSRPLMLDGRHGRLVLVNDVTARLRTDATLRESEARFRQMAEHIQEAFFIVDMTTHEALYVSPTWAEIWGRPIGEGRDPRIWFESIHHDDQAQLTAGEEAVLRGETSVSVFRVIRPDRTIRWVRGSRFPVRDENGKVYRMVGVASDITEMKRAEEQLLQSQKMDAIGRLAGGIAHDFNNILTVILSWSDVLFETTPPDDARHPPLQEIKWAGERAAGLTRQLLAFSRKQVLAPRVLELNAIITDVNKFLRRIVGENIELRTTLDPALGRVRADPGQLEQVIMNLVVNARDAMPDGGTLTIETTNTELHDTIVRDGEPVRSGRYVMVSVRDTGTGMDAATQSHLFEPFFTTKGAGKGTGLGLATVYGIVEQSGGFISVTSELGEGTTFKLYFPPSGDIAPVTEAPSGPRPTLRGTETILVVEDEEQLRILMLRILKSKGYTVLTAENGEQALQLAAEYTGTIHLLVSDVIMPRMSGPELAQRLAETRPAMRVLHVSGYADDTVTGHRLLSIDVPFLQKPFTPDTLSQHVREVLDG